MSYSSKPTVQGILHTTRDMRGQNTKKGKFIRINELNLVTFVSRIHCRMFVCGNDDDDDDDYDDGAPQEEQDSVTHV